MRSFNVFEQKLDSLGESKMLINTLNAHSYNLSRTDEEFEMSLRNCDVLLPDGVASVWAKWMLEGRKIKKTAGADVFYYNMNRIQNSGGKVFFLGSSPNTLQKIKDRAAKEYPNVEVHTYSPPYKSEFSPFDNQVMIYAVNKIKPDVLFIGMTAPKQEKWAYKHFDKLNTGHICCIGAVFDFYAGTIRRAPEWMIKRGLEWFYRLVKEPKRMARRYLIGNPLFVWYVIQDKFKESIYVPFYPVKNKAVQKSKLSLTKKKVRIAEMEEVTE